MKLEDAPTAGWYPDPELSGLLRWWHGDDWSDDRRALPTATEIEQAVSEPVVQQSIASIEPLPSHHRRRDDADDLVFQVREAARAEVDRAADLLSQRATTALRQGRSVIADHLDPVVRWIKIALVVAAIAVIAWFVFQLIAQATLLEWLGDRIDNVTD